MPAPTNRPRILYVTEFWPKNNGNGAELRSRHVLHALEHMGNVDVFVLDEPADGVKAVSNFGDSSEGIASTRLELRRNAGLAGRIRWLLSPRTPYPHGCGVSPVVEERFLARARDFDLIWFFKLRAANMFGQQAWRKAVVDIDDVPSTYLQTALEGRIGFSERILSVLRFRAWRQREKLLGERFPVLAVCSECDRRYLRRAGVGAPLHIIPNGFEKPDANPMPNPVSPPRIGFIGFLNYLANRDGVCWFIRECWPLIKTEIPEVRLRIVGKGSESIPCTPQDGIDRLGWVANPTEEIATWSSMIVPIRLGAGTRVKIAQGFARKCPVVSTALGAYGYEVANGRDLFIADTAAGFAKACLLLIRQPEEARKMTERAWQLFLNNWTWDAITPRVWATAEDCLRGSGKRQGALEDSTLPG